MRTKIDAAYGDGCDASAQMNVMAGKGSLADIKAFVKDATAMSGQSGL